MNNVFFTRNRNKLYETLPDGALLAVCSGVPAHRTADEDHRFFANRNFVYLTGVEEPDCVLLARRVHGEVIETLYIREPDEEAEKWGGRRITINEAAAASGISDCNIAYRSTFDAAFHKLANDTYFNEIHLCIETNRGQERDGNRRFHAMITEQYPNLAVVNAYPCLALQRTIKAPEEIGAIERALVITRGGILRMLAACKHAETEADLFAEFMYAIHKSGAVEPAFKPIISCGGNNFYLHYDTPTGKLIDGALCLADVGARVENCCVDISRVFPVNGAFNERQRLVYGAALAVNDELTAAIKPGMPFTRIDELNRELTFARLKSAGLLTDIADIGRYVWHRCTHHVGFDVHDAGSYQYPIAEGMFFTMDVGIYIREWGVGLRLEDNCLVTAAGLRSLSADIPRTIRDIEAAMA